MQNEYLVTSGEETIGRVQVQRQGLYYYIHCRCNITGCVRYQLVASSEQNTVDLGLCVPMDGKFGVETKIPCKRLGEGSFSFRLVPRRRKSAANFVPVSPDEPFAYIRQLQNAHLARLEGAVGIVLPEHQTSSDNPTGQWSEPITSE